MASTEKKFSLTLRTNFTPKTGSEKKRREFLQKIAIDFKGDKRFILMPEPIGKWSDGEKHNHDIHCNKKLASRLRNEFQLEAEAMGLETLSMVLLCGPESHFCYAGKPNNMIIDPLDENGNMPVQKCTLEISRSSNNVGHITPGGELVKNEYWESWIPNNLFSTKKCRTCFFALNCFGNACVHKNQMQKKIVCPKEKKQEDFLVSRILQYIARNQ
jgi:radical SAM protein with 4Fe4S-binding SPASM domain